METDLILKLISVTVVFMYAGILMFFKKDSVSHGVGILISIAVMTALVAEFISLNLAFVFLICSVILFLILTIIGKNHGSEQ